MVFLPTGDAAMPPLFAFKPGPGWKGTMSIGTVTLAWQEWTLVLLVCSVAFTLFSAFLAHRHGRWWLTLPIALLTAMIACIYRMFWRGSGPDDDFEDSCYVFVALVPLVIVHAVVSFTLPRSRASPAEPVRRYNSQ